MLRRWDLLGDAVNTAASMRENSTDLEGKGFTAGIEVADHCNHVGVRFVTTCRNHNKSVADVIVQIRHDDALAIDLGERENRHNDDLK